jgi:REP element-mobilizing transposase RayT
LSVNWRIFWGSDPVAASVFNVLAMGLNPSPSGETFRFFVLLKAYGGRHLWPRGYFVALSGNVTDEVIQGPIRQQEGTEPDDGGDNFRVTKS